MGSKLSRAKRLRKQEEKKNKEIEERLQKEKEIAAKEIKLLITGTGDSGKSTFVKQIQILFKEGFTDEDKKAYLNVIRFNLIAHTKMLINAARELNIPLLKENEDLADDFLESAGLSKTMVPPNVVQSIKRLWKDPALRIAYDRRSEFQLPDSASYFLDNIDRIIEPSYSPSEQDVLRSRIPTTGVKVLTFTLKDLPWRVVDVGGQRSERRKWIHQFDDVTVLIYVVALSEYDQKLYEDESINRMRESLALFDKTVNHPSFKKKNCILLFNKRDLFEEKISKVDLTVCWPEYDGGLNYNNATEFIKNKFLETGTIKSKKAQRQIITHFTCATDTDNIKNVFDSIQNTVVTSNNQV
ncbi:guanine nucleotide-binding protein g(o) subunit alpha [Anaeramoeba ignava]|uniref:Guanine nucleotide-binding protein g(O) subunit alpha n=1 Tax=Anaeramoeba ignava TaxID=1746090 RepID=A0A9Q0RCE0_ANAIG|nr:guanine nucleotide-binding protein g(o) subunit alpha [Anaeramoeba ignava]